jgi:metal-responsive CopG/Arc/MetJ family transcriptional regulator
MKKIGRPRTDTEAITLRLSRDVIQEIDAVRRDEEDIPTRPEMIRRMLQDWLEKKGKSEG